MRYKLAKLFKQRFISTNNYYISFTLTFVIILFSICLNQIIINQSSNMFNNIDENSAYILSTKCDNPNDYIAKKSKEFENLGLIKSSYYASGVQYINTDEYTFTNFYFNYLDLDSSFLEYKKFNVEINYYSDKRNGILVNENVSSKYHFVKDTKYKIKKYSYEDNYVETEVIGTYKSDKLRDEYIFGSISIFDDEISAGIVDSKSNYDFEFVFDKKIDKKFNAKLQLIDNSIMTKQYMINFMTKQFNDIFVFFDKILYAFLGIMLISSLILLFNYLDNRDEKNINNLFYETKSKTITNDIFRIIRSFILITIICMILYLICLLIFKLIFGSNLPLNYNLFYFLIVFIIDIGFVIIYDVLKIDNNPRF